jgi:dihydroflavonol-4-reductase
VTSSSVVHGYNDGPSVRDEHGQAVEDTPVPYVAAKIRQEQAALETAQRLGLDLILAAPTLVVGPFAPALGPSNALITTYLEDQFRFTFPGGGNIVAAADVGRGHALLARSGASGERYILGGENVEWRELHTLVSDLCGTTGPSITASHSACYVAAVADELRAELLGRVPLTSRAQATMVGRYYWYSSDKAAALGFAPVTAREAVATALAWLVASRHLSREARTRLRLSDEVWDARRRLRASERHLRKAA